MNQKGSPYILLSNPLSNVLSMRLTTLFAISIWRNILTFYVAAKKLFSFPTLSPGEVIGCIYGPERLLCAITVLTKHGCFMVPEWRHGPRSSRSLPLLRLLRRSIRSLPAVAATSRRILRRISAKKICTFLFASTFFLQRPLASALQECRT